MSVIATKPIRHPSTKGSYVYKPNGLEQAEEVQRAYKLAGAVTESGSDYRAFEQGYLGALYKVCEAN